MEFLRGAIGVALSAACVLPLAAGPALGQLNRTPAQRVHDMQRIIEQNNRTEVGPLCSGATEEGEVILFLNGSSVIQQTIIKSKSVGSPHNIHILITATPNPSGANGDVTLNADVQPSIQISGLFSAQIQNISDSLQPEVTAWKEKVAAISPVKVLTYMEQNVGRFCKNTPYPSAPSPENNPILTAELLAPRTYHM
jgi:hypothetical protein